MKSVKTVILTLVLSIGFLFPSCDDGLVDCDCSFVRPHFDITDLLIHNTEQSMHYFRFINPDQDSIAFDQFEGIYLDYLVDYHSSINFNFSLMNSAYGCSCLNDGHQGSTTEKFESIEIITLNDFDDAHPANSSINDLFTVPFESTLQDTLSLDDFLAENSSFIESEDLRLKLTKAPENNPTFHVNVILKLSTGEEYQAKNTPKQLY